MEQWYALYTKQGSEIDAAELIQRKINPSLYSACRILRKNKVFRSGGVLHILEDFMFPGYLFIRTEFPNKLSAQLKRARSFPQMVEEGSDLLVPVEKEDLSFLKEVCGEELDKTMGVTKIRIGADRRIESAGGILSRYLNQIVRLNLHKRFAVVDVELFHRKQEILFGLFLEQDQTVSMAQMKKTET